ncbi:MAG: plasmid mobilization relaxosome protein MobC [Clostridia bacterium]|nr:plasmid mobilization relaxosome protein MobC [Clostridia bacterium]
MANRKRNIQMKFDVTEEERELIRQKMAQLPTSQIGAYLRKMAIDGYIIYTDMTEIKKFNKELQAIGNNVNQIAKRVNTTSRIYDTNIEEIKERLNEIWQLQRRILLSLH